VARGTRVLHDRCRRARRVAAMTTPGSDSGVDARFDSLDRRLDEFETNIIEALDRCMRRQLWTVIVAMVVPIVVFSSICGGLLAAFGREAGGRIASFVFTAIAVGAPSVNMLRQDCPRSDRTAVRPPPIRATMDGPKQGGTADAGALRRDLVRHACGPELA